MVVGFQAINCSADKEEKATKLSDWVFCSWNINREILILTFFWDDDQGGVFGS